MGSAAQAVIDIDLEGEKATSELNQLTSAINGFAAKTKSAMYAVGAVIAVDKIRDAAVEMLDVFGKANKIATRLNTTLETTGNQTGFTTTQLAGMREELAATSTTSEAALAEVQNIFARTKVMGGDIFVEATQTAMDFATAMDTDVKGAAEELAEAMVDPANEVEKFRRFGITFTDQEKLMMTQMAQTGRGMEAQRFVLNRLNEAVGGQSKAAFGTFAGQQASLGNKIEGLKAKFGGFIADALMPLMPLVTGLIDGFTMWMPVIESIAQGFIDAAAAVIAWITPITASQETIASWAATVQSVMEHWDDYIAIALLNAGANVMAFATDVQHYFTEAIPTYAKSLWIIMKDVFFQLDDLFSAVFTNLKKQLSEVWEAIKSLMAGEMPTFTPTSLLEGFELKLSELPTVTAKAMGETEALMRQAADDLTMEIGADIAKKTQENLDKAKAKEAAAAVPVVEDKALTLGPKTPTSGGSTGTEGILAMADRISAAASAVKLEVAVGSVATQVAETNKLIAGGLEVKDSPIKVDVKQADVVDAIRASTEAIVKASMQPQGFT